jgi:starch synthase
MAKALNILFVSSEVYPYSKEGGLADVAYSLPLALRELGHDVRVMTPKYGAISERKNKIHDINRLKDIPIPVGPIFSQATVKSSSIQNPRNKVQAYITTNYDYFDSLKGVYTDPSTGSDYANNAERFIFFNRSVIETCITLEWFPDIIHINDWQTSILPALVKLKFADKFKKTKIVLTIHNISRQGEFALKEFAKTHLPDNAKDIYKFKNKFNFLKGAIQLSLNI